MLRKPDPAAYLEKVTLQFVTKHNVRFPSDITLKDDEAMAEWCRLVAWAKDSYKQDLSAFVKTQKKAARR